MKLRNGRQSNLFYKVNVFGIDIVSPIKSNLKKTKESLLLIKNTDSALFKKVLRIKAILIYPGGTEMGCVFEVSRIYVNQLRYLRGLSTSWWASTLVHEAWHIDQYKRGIREYGTRAERGAYLVQKRFLRKINSWSEVKWLDKMYKLQWWKPEPTAFKKATGYDSSAEGVKKEFEVFIKWYRQGKLNIKEIEL